MSNAIEHIRPGEQLERTESAPVVSQSDAMISMIERVTMNPDADIDKLQRLLEMRENIMAKNAEMAFTRAMKEAQHEMPQILRTAENNHTKSRYATLEAISAEMNPIITAHGFTISFGTDKSDLPNHYGVTCEVAHEDGHTKHYRADIPSDLAGSQGKANKNATQAFGSTMTYGRRYLKCLIFDIQVTNEDDDGHAAGHSVSDGKGSLPSGRSEPISEGQVRRILDLIEETGTDIAKFCEFLGVEAIPGIRANKFDDAVRCLEIKREKQFKAREKDNG